MVGLCKGKDVNAADTVALGPLVDTAAPGTPVATAAVEAPAVTVAVGPAVVTIAVEPAVVTDAGILQGILGTHTPYFLRAFFNPPLLMKSRTGRGSPLIVTDTVYWN